MKHILNMLCMLFAVWELSAQQNNITGYEYWLDNNYAAKTAQAVSPVKTFQLQTSIPYDKLAAGIHTFCVRFRDTKGAWSPTVSSYFYKQPAPTTGNTIIAYEYWVDNEARVLQTISPAAQYTFLQNIAVNGLSAGIHSMNIRFKDARGKWSSTVSNYFYKISQPVDNRLVAYEYWINGQYDQKYSGSIDHQKSFYLIETLDCSSGTKATNTLYFRFQDAKGNWSSILAQNFYRPVEPDFTSIVGLSEVTFTNTSKYADQYQWDFGDGNTGVQENPEHSYANPGTYKVKLIAKNNMFTDSVFHSVKVEYTAIQNPTPDYQDLTIAPNPAKHTVTISMNIRQASDVRLVLYNPVGQQVATVYDQYVAQGKKEILLDISQLTQGAYLLEMQTNNNKITKRLLVK